MQAQQTLTRSNQKSIIKCLKLDVSKICTDGMGDTKITIPFRHLTNVFITSCFAIEPEIQSINNNEITIRIFQVQGFSCDDKIPLAYMYDSSIPLHIYAEGR